LQLFKKNSIRSQTQIFLSLNLHNSD